MITIDEAIVHCLEVAERYETQEGCQECAADHRQLAEWLTEFKETRAELDRLYPILENARMLSNAVFEFKEKFDKLISSIERSKSHSDNEFICEVVGAFRNVSEAFYNQGQTAPLKSSEGS